MSRRTNRRNFIKTSAAIGAGFWAAGGVSPKKSISALEEIRFACVGVGGKGSSDSSDANKNGKVVAMADVDDQTLNGKKKEFKDAKTFNDYRKMFEELGDNFDAVTVSTPDHSHAGAAVMAMRMGKHAFCQKPLTHSIYESRLMGDIAREKKLTTQMGNQGTALTCLRKSAALIKGGVVGKVKEVHVWTNRPVWPQGGVKPKYQKPPEHVKWDLWIGPAKMREYSPEIHPFKWRGYWDFGTGALGDMACHTLNMSFMALGLQDPTSVKAESAGHNKDTYPAWSIIDFAFPERNGRDAVKMVWYDGTKTPPPELMADLPKRGGKRHYTSAALIVGDKGKFYSPGDYGGDEQNTGLIVDGEFTNYKKIRDIKADYVRSPGHFVEFAEAIKAGTQSMSNFAGYAGPLSETILLGNLAVWASGEEIKWNAKDMKIESDHAAKSELEKIVRHDYHNGYKL